MSGFTEFQASGASDTHGKADIVLTWAHAQSMMPLVRHIVTEIMTLVQRMQAIEPEKDRLDRHRHDLSWPERRRRYELTEEMDRLTKALRSARAELDVLGVALLDEATGFVGFPTLVNNQRAYFSWKLDEDELNYWQFADGHRRRAVPAAWKEPEPMVRRSR